MSDGSWSVVCGDFAGRERMVHVLVRGDEVVIVAPAGEIAKLGPTAAAEFRCAVEQAAEVAKASGPGRPLMEIGAARAARPEGGEVLPAATDRAAGRSYRDGTRPWASGPAAMVTAAGGGR